MFRTLFILFFFTCFIGFSQTDSSEFKQCIPTPDRFENQVVYFVVDVHPEYPGGLAAFFGYLQKSTSYPSEKTDANLSTIRLTFIVDTLGNTQNVCVIANTQDTNFKRHIKEVVEKGQKWVPAKLNDKKVCVRLTLPIRIHMR